MKGLVAEYYRPIHFDEVAALMSRKTPSLNYGSKG